MKFSIRSLRLSSIFNQLLKAEKKREYAIQIPANPELPQNAVALQSPEALESAEDIPENKEVLV